MDFVVPVECIVFEDEPALYLPCHEIPGRDRAISRTPVQAALERLASEGLVTISPQQGIVVREFSIRDIVDLFEMRVAFETFYISGRCTC